MLKENQLIKIKWHNQSKNHYIEKGYVFTKIKDEFLVKAQDLSKGCHAQVIVICEYCGEEFTKQYARYLVEHENGKDCCKKCLHSKQKESCLRIYGVENIFQLDSFQEKATQSCLEKYGFGNVFSSPIFQEKIHQTNLERYGNKNAIASKVIREKINATFINKYGVSTPSKLEAIKEKAKATNMKKYGCSCSLHSPLIAEKVIQTNLKKYGVKYTTQVPEVIQKMRDTLYKNNTVPTSKNELKVCSMLKEIYGEENCFEGFPLGTINFDCLVTVEGEKIDVEYDGWYWHKDRQEKDKRRNYFAIRRGYRVLRIKSNTELPTKEQLINAIDYLVKGNHWSTEIILDI